ncbi:MAG TPA: SGNH/GDSL hydrolase family protein [Rhodospirillales bacterium]|nr:SGNH/GDSL hydrolase family protein [Rhodospirillales bacterium]
MAINLGILAVGLVLIDLIFGAWIFGENYGVMIIPKNIARQFDVQGLYGGGRSIFKRDKNGLRGRYEDPSKIDILTVGGSTTNEILVTEGKTWSDVLAAEFSANGNPMVVVNAGVDGQTTIGHLKNFDLWFPKIPDLKARYVLVYVGINDLVRLHRENHAPKQDRLTESRRLFKQYMLNNSAIYAFFRNVRGMIRARDARLVHTQENYSGSTWALPEKQPDVDAAERKWAAGLNAYGRRLRALIRRIRVFGAVPILVTQSRAGYRLRGAKVWGRLQQDGSVDTGAYVDLSALNRRTMSECRAAKAICIDLAAELFFEDGDHYDPLHTTPKGSAKIGHYLYGKLKDIVLKKRTESN